MSEKNFSHYGSPVVINQNNIGLGTLLLVLFVGLKLTGFIAWSWFWVLSPITIPLCFVAALLIFGGIIWSIGAIMEIHKD